jgi:hypothetical protein
MLPFWDKPLEVLFNKVLAAIEKYEYTYLWSNACFFLFYLALVEILPGAGISPIRCLIDSWPSITAREVWRYVRNLLLLFSSRTQLLIREELLE